MSKHIIKINSENKNLSKDLEIFNKEIKKGKWFVKYYANWCPHCVNMQRQWNNLETHDVLNNEKINIAEVEESYFDKLNYKPDAVGFPTIKLYNNGEGENFQGDRTTENMALFLSKKQSGGGKKKSKNTIKKNKKNKNTIKKNRKNKNTLKTNKKIKKLLKKIKK